MTSSKRYKKNIRPFEEDFSKILKTESKVYNCKSTGEESIGYIAEDFVDLGLDRLVSFLDGKVESIHYNRIPLYLTEVVKTQQKQIERQEAHIQELRAALERIEEQLR